MPHLSWNPQRGAVPASRTLAVTVLASAAAAVVAMGARGLLEPWLGQSLAFVFAFPAVVLAALWAGPWAAIGTALLCAVWYLVPGVPPSPSPPGTGGFEVGVFLFSSAVIALLTHLATRPAAIPVPAASTDTHSDSDTATLFWLRAAVLLSIILPMAALVAAALVAHESALAAAQRRMERLAVVAHEHALKLLQTGELLLQHGILLSRDLDASQLRAQQARLHEQLAAVTNGLEQVHSVRLLDAEGNVVVSSRVANPPPRNIADTPAFQLHRQTRGQVIVTAPRTGAVSEELFFDLSRRRETSEGSFNGLAQVGLNPADFTNFYRELVDSERGVVLTLVHQDGFLVARWPVVASAGARVNPASPMAAPMARGERAGRTRGESSFDGVVRLGAFRKVGNYPVYVFAGTDEGAALTGWTRDVAALAAFIIPLSLLLSLISFQALRRTREHIAAAAQLRHEAQERQKMEAALRQSQKLEAVGHLTGGVAHDFNNLLMVINLNASLLKRRVPAEYERQLDAIERAVAGGKKLTRQLLAFSRRQPLVPRLVDLAELMPALADLVRPALGSSIGLEAEVEPGTRCLIVDTGELELALINLAVNAKDAMPDGGMVRIRVHNDGDVVQISVNDTGTGIAPEHLERVFEPFYTTKPVGEGTGLGLSQVYGLCARAGGEARVESTVGQGTTVFLRFPGSECAGAEGGIAPAPPLPAQLSLRVLMVEDNRDVAMATRELLEGAGCRVSHAANPGEALEVLAEARGFDIVLSDVVMPGGMDGLQLALEIAKLYPALPVVLMTGYAGKLRELEAGNYIVLPKPFEPDLLLRTLREQAAARK